MITEEERCVLKVKFSVKGIGHYTLNNLLTRVPHHGTWRFFGDVPFLVKHSEGDVLVEVRSDVARVVKIS